MSFTNRKYDNCYLTQRGNGMAYSNITANIKDSIRPLKYQLFEGKYVNHSNNIVQKTAKTIDLIDVNNALRFQGGIISPCNEHNNTPKCLNTKQQRCISASDKRAPNVFPPDISARANTHAFVSRNGGLQRPTSTGLKPIKK